MARKRNYRAEYKRRIERALAQGYSRKIARGHTPEGFVSPRAARFLKASGIGPDVKPGADYADVVKRSEDFPAYVTVDAVRVFDGYVPKRGRVHPTTGEITQQRHNESREAYLARTRGWEGESAAEYALRLEELKKRDGAFQWTEEGEFVKAMRANGASAQEAYSFWFSP
jgi:hypothetical protein